MSRTSEPHVPFPQNRVREQQLENNTIPNQTRRVLLHSLDKKGGRFQHIGSWPGIRNGYPEQLRQSGPLKERDLLEFQRERQQLQSLRFQLFHKRPPHFRDTFRLHWS